MTKMTILSFGLVGNEPFRIWLVPIGGDAVLSPESVMTVISVSQVPGGVVLGPV